MEKSLFGNDLKQKNIFPYYWKLSNGFPQSLDNSVKKNDYKVFGVFVSCGGTSLGAKMAGFNHLGGVEIQEKIANIYKKNLNPKYLFVQDIRDFIKEAELGNIPDELYNLDILEGSPPCTTFSFCGDMQESFGKEKKFAEGMKKQTLDDLVFEYCNLALMLKPKVVFFENVAGFKSWYSLQHYRKVVELLSESYFINEYLINAKHMGLPQSRTRFFIIATRKDFENRFISLNYNENLVPFCKILDKSDKKICNALKNEKNLSTYKQSLKNNKKAPFARNDDCFVKYNKPIPCLTNHDDSWVIKSLRRPNEKERKLASSFPMDFDFKSKSSMIFGTGMCVAPLVAANMFHQIKLQFLDKI